MDFVFSSPKNLLSDDRYPFKLIFVYLILYLRLVNGVTARRQGDGGEAILTVVHIHLKVVSGKWFSALVFHQLSFFS